jgi:DNA repair photolyase
MSRLRGFSMPFQIFEADARTILSPVSGFLKAAGFTHSLTPSRNCTFGCSYCYVPTMRVQGGLKPEDWTHWGQHTTFKQNAAVLLARELRGSERIYCSPLTDPYQPAESRRALMREILEVLAQATRAPAAFVIQTRGPLILRDVDLLTAVAKRTRLRVSFSVTTDREQVRKIFEPHCATIEDRWLTMQALRDRGIEVTATLAPLLPCDPAALLDRALQTTAGPVVADSLHVRAVKRSGATTRDPALQISRRKGWAHWLDAVFQEQLLSSMRDRAHAAKRRFAWGPAGFSLLLEPPLSAREQTYAIGVYNCAGEKRAQ